MAIRKSIVLTALLPDAIDSLETFEAGCAAFKNKGYSVIEFYAPFDQAASRRGVLERYGLSGIYLAALYQKRNALSLCAVSEGERRTAVKETFRCIDAAKAAGAEAVLITGGLYPGKDKETDAWSALEKSISELIEYAGTLRVLLEPGDRDVDARQLAGPTEETVVMAKRICQKHNNFALTMDTSHMAQLGENWDASLRLAQPFCDHVHLANCILKPGHPLYGDKHPLFDSKDAAYSLSELQTIAKILFEGYAPELTVSIEIIYHGEDQTEYMNQVLAEEEWFSNM